ncbi:MAG: hypothetical protein IPN20_25245 [Haliscomenobacter sp.]|nr:hypothetical protein [Haliscomenobacter sp.]
MSSLFTQQLDYTFNRPVTDPAWYWQPREEEADPFHGEDPLTALSSSKPYAKIPASAWPPIPMTRWGRA